MLSSRDLNLFCCHALISTNFVISTNLIISTDLVDGFNLSQIGSFPLVGGKNQRKLKPHATSEVRWMMLPRSQCEGGIMPLLRRQDHHAGWTQLDQIKMIAG